MTLASWLYRASKIARDVRAVRRGRIVQRAENRIVGRVWSRLFRKVYRWR